DGLDNNCNARTDEANLLEEAPDDITCFDQGVCRGTRVLCTDGEWACDYPPTYVFGAEQTCDGIDDDCDGSTDEDFDLQVDLAHCGACNRACAFDRGIGVCTAGNCELGECEPGWHNADGNDGNGCEYGPCDRTANGMERCDGIDNDCDGRVDEAVRLSCGTDVGQCRAGFQTCIDGVLGACEDAIDPVDETCNGFDDDCDNSTDEGFDLLRDPSHCGRCGFACDVPNAVPRCEQGQCAVESCNEGFADANGVAADGCELPCVLTNDGVEACDGRDNDCDGRADEGIDLETDPANCGGCGRACVYANATPLCEGRVCAMGACADGFYDIDGDPANGCEYACQFQSDDDPPDPGFVDANCDGIDGEVARAIFVAPMGNDVGQGTRTDPVATFARAMDLALNANPPRYIVAAEGAYPGTVTLRSGVHIYGGYRREDAWRRAANFETIIQGGSVGLLVQSLNAPSSLHRVTIRSATNAEVGGSSYGVRVIDSADHLTLDACRVIAGD
ncbi:MAG: hypothetical protein KC583_03200, partial [Myxococcales bacterium]|nr:hypothetical protein [Myxococcales bacterium]